MLEAEKIKNIEFIRKDIIDRLLQLSSPELAESIQRFFPYKICCYGVKTPVLRQLAKEIYLNQLKSWSLRQILELTEALLKLSELESRLCGIFLLSQFRSQLGKSHLNIFRRWLKSGYLDNWALIDTFSLEVIHPLVERNPGAMKELERWCRESNFFLRRAALVSVVKTAGTKKSTPRIFSMVKKALSLSPADDLVAKAAGWLLREAGKNDSTRLEKFLSENGRRLPGVTVRYALEKFPEDRKKYFLEITKNLRRHHEEKD
ncbi:MAG: DNA alkylation repair protein [Candidatus Saccharicenans sp.]|nr:DNA alkylation repair protein [Candidatus Saccharicenans sp.]